MTKKEKDTDESIHKPTNTDRWFDAQLVRLYTDIANEPLPEDLVQLVKKLKDKNKD